MRRIAIKGAYCALLERVVPGLEEVLYRKLERLDVKVTMHALREGVSTPPPTCAAMKRPRPAVQAELPAGRPSVIVLGARLNSDKRFAMRLSNECWRFSKSRCVRGQKAIL